MVIATDLIGDIRWAPDGSGLYYLSSGAIHFVDSASGTAHQVYRPAPPWVLEQFATFDVSRDGEAFLLVVRSRYVRCAARIVTKAGEIRDLPPFASDCRAIAWTHDEQAVLASVHGSDGSIPLWMLPLDGGRPPILVPPERLQVVDPSVRPDGKELLLGARNPRPDVWTLSGFAPGVR